MRMLLLDFINVGYGDAVLIRDTAAPFSMLVDCGDVQIGSSRPEGRRVTAAGYLRRQGIHQLDLLVLTHLHLDHAGGLAHLLPDIQIRRLWTNCLPPEACWGGRAAVPGACSSGARCLITSMNVYLRALSQLRGQGTVIQKLQAPMQHHALTSRLHADVFLEDTPLHQRQSTIWQHVLSGQAGGGELDELDGFINNTSIRLRLSWGGTAVELPGDVYAACWERHQLSPCAIVKLPHHGHGDSVTPRLLDMLRPAHTVISVSDNRTDDCPSAAVIQAVLDAGSNLYFTDAVHAAGQPAFHSAVRFRIRGEGEPLEALEPAVSREAASSS